jgi:hypothetical protein
MGVYVQTYLDHFAKECFCFDFCFGTACGTIILVVATGTTISCSLGKQCEPVLSLSFLDVHVQNTSFSL